MNTGGHIYSLSNGYGLVGPGEPAVCTFMAMQIAHSAATVTPEMSREALQLWATPQHLAIATTASGPEEVLITWSWTRPMRSRRCGSRADSCHFRRIAWIQALDPIMGSTVAERSYSA